MTGALSLIIVLIVIGLWCAASKGMEDQARYRRHREKFEYPPDQAAEDQAGIDSMRERMRQEGKHELWQGAAGPSCSVTA